MVSLVDTKCVYISRLGFREWEFRGFLPAGQVSNVDEGVVEACEDVGNAENNLTLANLGSERHLDLLFLNLPSFGSHFWWWRIISILILWYFNVGIVLIELLDTICKLETRLWMTARRHATVERLRRIRNPDTSWYLLNIIDATDVVGLRGWLGHVMVSIFNLYNHCTFSYYSKIYTY